MLEIASEGKGHVDVSDKREFYERFGIAEYWRFDHTPDGQWHGSRIAGDLLVDGEYAPVEITESPDGVLQGYSPALGLFLRWEQGELAFHDPATGPPIATFESERARADAELAARVATETRADNAEVERNAEHEARVVAEARVLELEELLLHHNP